MATETNTGPAPALDPRLSRLLIWIARVVLFLLALQAIRIIWPGLMWALGVLSPFLIGLVLAYVLDPVVSVVQQRFKLGRIGGMVVLALFLLAVAALVLTILLPILIAQTSLAINGIESFASENLPRAIEHLREQVDEMNLPAAAVEPTRRPEAVPAPTSAPSLNLPSYPMSTQPAPEASAKPPEDDPLSEQLLSSLDDWERHIPRALSYLWEGIEGLAGLGAGAVAFFMTSVFVGIIAFYLLLDFANIPSWIRTFVPAHRSERFWHVLGRVHRNLGGFLRGQIMVCIIMGSMVTVGLLLVGPTKYALLIGLLAGTVNFIPYLGPTVGAAPAVLWALFSPEVGPEMNDHIIQLIKVLSVFAAAQAIDGFLISPNILGKQAALHPLLVMLALLIGAQGGIGGMIIAVPVMVIAKVLFIELVLKPAERRRAMEEHQEPGAAGEG